MRASRGMKQNVQARKVYWVTILWQISFNGKQIATKIYAKLGLA